MRKNNDTLTCDFVGGAVGHRFRQGGGRGQALPKAIGLKGGSTPHVIDATAGLGRDAFLLASLGARVTLIERNDEMHRLLKEGMERAEKENNTYADIIGRMTLIHGDAKSIIPTIDADVVLVDPMHPPRNKSALVKKEMRQIREIVGTDPDAKELMEIALKYALKRVVLKWPLRADPMEGIQNPSHQITGKSTRYDVFIQT
ncbi:MAG: class I SAM-dependent methyltransferase [Emcibacteraceae bacterium]|nr:class I SAM-dependent methyltransferase [Emcibacteraceae bacterium]MDG1859620.1 class I SAM-dependent methyltransferase [Emcibacteraceae bacterium]